MSRSQMENVVSHWHKLFDGAPTSPQEFYAAVEEALEQRKVPGIPVSRIDWDEGGVLSPKREYLHVEGDRHTFDMCAAPFGTGFGSAVRSRAVRIEPKPSLCRSRPSWEER